MTSSLIKTSLIFTLIFHLFLPVTKGSETTLSVTNILSIEISSSINPATLNYLENGFNEAKNKNYDLILIKMNTPGGLVSTTKKILTLFGESNIPIIVWVTPEGASATSAGAIIASGAHLLYMNSGTNIGAATPITMGKDLPSGDMKSKAINDLKALVQSLSEARGRNQTDFGLMIEKAKSYKSKDALKAKIINDLIHTDKELISKLNNQTIKLKNSSYTIITNNPKITEFDMDMGQKLLNILSNPSLTYILFLIGAALIYLELQAPGGFIAGGVGAICLVMAGIGFQLLPLNFGALGLIILSFILFVLEAFVTSFGILSLAGLASLIAGSLFLFRTDNAYLYISKTVIFSSILAVTSFLLLVLYIFIKAIQKNKEISFHTLSGKTGIITEIHEVHNNEYYYSLKVSGEIWKAKSKIKFELNDDCKIVNKDAEEMILTIKK